MSDDAKRKRWAQIVVNESTAIAEGESLTATWDQGHAKAVDAIRSVDGPTDYVVIVKRASGVLTTYHCINPDDAGDMILTLAGLCKMIQEQVDRARRGEPL